MQRQLHRLADETFDLLVIGGGITGAAIARDAAGRGLRCALVEKGDFAAAASSANSKLIHGGLRYLRNLELSLVRESLRERRIWQAIAPHMVQPLPFLLPVWGSAVEQAKLEIGLTLYDWLAYDRNWSADPHQRIPHHQWQEAATAVASEPVIASPDLKGALVYYDAQMYSPERLALECLIDADANGAVVANYVEAEALLLWQERVSGAVLRDRLTNDYFEVRARETVVAVGPWSDVFLERALQRPAPRMLRRSKGIHLVMPALTRSFALAVSAEGRHFFVLPWHGHALIGTTDTPFEGDPGTARADEKDIEDLLGFARRHLPAADLTSSRVEHAFAGVRPLVEGGTGDTYRASRRAAIVDHGREEGFAGLISVIGGKWTTSRALAETTVDLAAEMVLTKARKCSTTQQRLPGGRFETYLAFEREMESKYPDLPAIAHLTRLYGAQLPSVLAPAAADPELLKPVGTAGDIAAQVVHAVRHEMAMTMEDVVLRRTFIGQLSTPDDATLQQVGRIMAAELQWNDTRRDKELDAVKNLYRAK